MSDKKISTEIQEALQTLNSNFDNLLEASAYDPFLYLQFLDHINASLANVSIGDDVKASSDEKKTENENNQKDNNDENDDNDVVVKENKNVDDNNNARKANDSETHAPDTVTNKFEKADVTLRVMIASLKNKMPNAFAISPKEKIIYPTHHPDFEGYSARNCVSVDSFLYSDDDVEELSNNGDIPREYCTKCGSTDTEPLNYVSHSASPDQLKFVFSQAVLNDLSGKTVVDIGSRLGSVLLVGSLFSNAKEYIGIEIDPFFSKLSQSTIEQFKLENVKVINDDVLNQAEKLKNADVVIMNNVFEFFVKPKAQRKIWNFIKSNLKSGTKLVSMPSLEKTFQGNNINIDLKEWVKEIDIAIPQTYQHGDHFHKLDEDLIESYECVHLYSII